MKHKDIVPGCESCIHRKTCPKAEDGKFCAQWASEAPKERSAAADPKARWRRGEEFED